MEIRTYLGIIGRYWWIVVLVALAAGVGIWVLDSQREPQYSGRARVLIRPSPELTDSRTVVDLVGQLGLRYVSGTYAQSFSSDSVKQTARQAAGLSVDEAARYPLEANVLPDTVVIELSGQGPDRQVLARYLDATMSSVINDTQPLFQVMELQALEPAQVPVAPSSPQPVRDVVVAVGLGIVLGLLLVFTIHYLRDTHPTSA
jgi:uncharacterized protein involved in exopolysaccharide biosynthesis